MSIKSIILVFLGGGLGSIARYYLSHVLNNAKIVNLNIGTFAVNVIGSFLIGLLLGYVLKNEASHQNIISFAVIGFCGGFTTFSSFSSDNLVLLKQGDYTGFIIYAIGSLLLGVAAVSLGFLLTK